MKHRDCDEARTRSPGRRWLDLARETIWFRLPVLFAALLGADIGAQLCRMWTTRHAPASSLHWAPLGTALLLAAALASSRLEFHRGLHLRGGGLRRLGRHRDLLGLARGRTLLTGGSFGPEASLVAVLACLAVALVLLGLAARNGRWRPWQPGAARAAA
jgi:hypothetical protein